MTSKYIVVFFMVLIIKRVKQFIFYRYIKNMFFLLEKLVYYFEVVFCILLLDLPLMRLVNLRPLYRLFFSHFDKIRVFFFSYGEKICLLFLVRGCRLLLFP